MTSFCSLTKTNFNCVLCFFCSLRPSNLLHFVWRLALETCWATTRRQISTPRGRGVNAAGRHFLLICLLAFCELMLPAGIKTDHFYGEVDLMSSYSQTLMFSVDWRKQQNKPCFLRLTMRFHALFVPRGHLNRRSYYSVHLVRMFKTEG